MPCLRACNAQLQVVFRIRAVYPATAYLARSTWCSALGTAWSQISSSSLYNDSPFPLMWLTSSKLCGGHVRTPPISIEKVVTVIVDWI